MKLLMLTALLAPTVFAEAQTASPGPLEGIFALSNPGHPVPEAVLENPNVDGVTLRFEWKTLEPEDGHFDWTALDGEIVRAKSHGKKVALSVGAGVLTPDWVYAAGARPFYLVWNQTYGAPPCSRQRIPIPWDPVYLSKWKGFVRGLAKRYDSDAAVSYIKIAGLNSLTQETFLPRSRGGPIEIRGAKCSAEDDVSNWLKAGYTRTKVEDAWESIAATFAQAFPDKPLGIMIVPKGFPPIDGQGRLLRGDGDFQVTRDLIAIGFRAYGTRFIAENNGLSAFWAWQPPADLAGKVTVAYQMLWAATGDRSCRMDRGADPCDPHKIMQSALNRGIDAGARYFEVYIADLLNPDVQGVLADVHRKLAK